MVVDQLAAGSWVFLFLWLVLIAYLRAGRSHPVAGLATLDAAGLVGVAAFLVGSAGDADGFRDAHDGADPPLAWLPAPVSGVLGVVGLVLTVLLFFGAGVRGPRAAASVVGRRPAAAAVAGVGRDQPAAGAGARLGRALRSSTTTRRSSTWPSPWPGSPFPSRSASRSCGTASSTSSWC